MKEPRWTAISESAFPWEKEALDWLRARLPDRDPWHVWSNFEFIDDEGKVNEIDALILSPVGFFLVEVKSRPGTLSGDAHTWTWKTDGSAYAYDNPLILANRKAKRLASLLRRQAAVKKARSRIPFVEPLIFLSGLQPENCKLSGNARAGAFFRGRPEAPNDDGILARLEGTGSYPPGGPLLGHDLARVICRAVIEAGIRPSNKHRRVGDYQLEAMIQEGDTYQDWSGTHVSAGVRRRVRIYGYAQAASQDARQALVRQATREFQILEGIDHPGILRVRDFKETELGPALLFDYSGREQRLDFLLREKGGQFNDDQRLTILRQLAETLKYAHQKKLVHRTLSPQSILVLNPEEQTLRLAVMNWQLATRGLPGSQPGQTALGTVSAARTAGTQHVEDYLDDPAKMFLAPEALWEGAPVGPHLDVFSLGVIAWQVFAGAPPALDVPELHHRLRAGNGLRISDALDGAGKALQDLIQFATCPDVSARIPSMADFLEHLELLEDELTAPAELATVDPAIARTGDRVEGGFTVVRRLGKGSTADVLLVKRDGEDEEMVLKVAIDERQNGRLAGEGETLRQLRHANIVEWRETLVVAGRTALLMKSAGKETLAEHLRHVRPSLDLVRRFGEELLQTAVFLEDQGVHHRDIKPDNIGLSQAAHSGKLQLVLFDFSLARTPLDNIRAGTRPYLDPFLSLVKPPRWDVHAERFALAMTLYQMVAGWDRFPTWGDGASEPALIEDEVTLDPALFDPNLREGLTEFFGKALRRDRRERFDNAEDMLREWRRVFDRLSAAAATDPFEVIARRADRDTAIAELGYGVEAQNVLDRMGIHNVRELLAVDRIRFRYLKSVGDKVRREIRGIAKRLAQLRPDLVAALPTVLDGDEAEGVRSVDELAGHLLPRRAAGDERPEDDALAAYLGLETEAAGAAGQEGGLWPNLGDAARGAGLSRPALTQAIVHARGRWLKSPSLTEVRDELAAFLAANGGIVSVAEAAGSLLASRGSAEQEDGARLRLAAAVLRACIEAEADLAQPRFQVFPGAGEQAPPLIAADVDHADYAIRLGRAADAFVDGGTEVPDGESLPSPREALKGLEEVARPASVSPLSSQRLVRLAAACGGRAAVSSRLELYPRGMAARRALRIALGSIIGLRVLGEAQLRERILGRYPQAEALPGRPALDALLAESGADLHWRPDGEHGAGYYPSRSAFGPSAGSTTFMHRAGTVVEENPSADSLRARDFEDRLAHAQRAGGFLVLTVAPRLARHARVLLERRLAGHGFVPVDLDALILGALKAEAAERRVDWAKVLEADAAGPGTRDWHHLLRLAGMARPRITAALNSRGKLLLLLNPGLLARLDLMDLVAEMQGAAGTAAGIAAVWLLVPVDGQGLPTLDGTPIPVVTQSQWTRIPSAWIAGGHRAMASAA